MSQIRGVVFHSRFDYIKHNLDNGARKKIKKDLSSQAIHILSDQVFPVNLYAFSVLQELDTALTKTVSGSSETLFQKIGQDFAETITDRYFFNYSQSQQPQKFLLQFQRLYQRLWAFGKFNLDVKADHKVQLSLKYPTTVYPAFHIFMESFLQKAVQICGGKEALIEIVDKSVENNDCRSYTIHWI